MRERARYKRGNDMVLPGFDRQKGHIFSNRTVGNKIVGKYLT